MVFFKGLECFLHEFTGNLENLEHGGLNATSQRNSTRRSTRFSPEATEYISKALEEMIKDAIKEGSTSLKAGKKTLDLGDVSKCVDVPGQKLSFIGSIQEENLNM